MADIKDRLLQELLTLKEGVEVHVKGDVLDYLETKEVGTLPKDYYLINLIDEKDNLDNHFLVQLNRFVICGQDDFEEITFNTKEHNLIMTIQNANDYLKTIKESEEELVKRYEEKLYGQLDIEDVRDI